MPDADPRKSCLLPVFRGVLQFYWWYLTPLKFFTRLFTWNWRRAPGFKATPAGPQEAYVVGATLLLVLFLVSRPNCFALRVVAIIITAQILLSHAVIMLRDVLVRPDEHHDSQGPVVRVDSATRWMMMALLSITQIVLSFAVLLRYFGDDFNPPIVNATTALYQSLITLTTLGYGDITPDTTLAMWIVILELIFFLFLLALKLPVAISAMRMAQLRFHRNSRFLVTLMPCKKGDRRHVQGEGEVEFNTDGALLRDETGRLLLTCQSGIGDTTGMGCPCAFQEAIDKGLVTKPDGSSDPAS